MQVEARPTTTSPLKVSPPAQPQRFSTAHRVRRKFRRWANEVRAQIAERAQAPRLASTPVHVNLNHTMVCNLRCVMCEQGLGGVPQQVMDHGVYARVRDELFDSISELSLTVMGDPFCVPKPFFEEILSDAERYDLRLEITTNALLLGDDAEIARLARALSRIMFSIDGATKETYERIRKPGKWSRLTDNVGRFVRARRRLAPWRRPLIEFNYVVMKSNLDELPDFVELAAGWDAYSITASLLITVAPAIANEALDENDPHLREVLAEARRRAWRRGIGFRVAGARPELDADRAAVRASPLQKVALAWSAVRPVFTRGANYLIERVGRRLKRVPRECPFLWSKAYVQIDGSVGTCCHPHFYLTGDLKRQSLREVWNSTRYRGLRASLNTEHPAGACRDCHLLRP